MNEKEKGKLPEVHLSDDDRLLLPQLRKQSKANVDWTIPRRDSFGPDQLYYLYHPARDYKARPVLESSFLDGSRWDPGMPRWCAMCAGANMAAKAFDLEAKLGEPDMFRPYFDYIINHTFWLLGDDTEESVSPIEPHFFYNRLPSASKTTQIEWIGEWLPFSKDVEYMEPRDRAFVKSFTAERVLDMAINFYFIWQKSRWGGIIPRFEKEFPNSFTSENEAIKGPEWYRGDVQFGWPRVNLINFGKSCFHLAAVEFEQTKFELFKLHENDWDRPSNTWS